MQWLPGTPLPRLVCIEMDKKKKGNTQLNFRWCWEEYYQSVLARDEGKGKDEEDDDSESESESAPESESSCHIPPIHDCQPSINPDHPLPPPIYGPQTTPIQSMQEYGLLNLPDVNHSGISYQSPQPSDFCFSPAISHLQSPLSNPAMPYSQGFIEPDEDESGGVDISWLREPYDWSEFAHSDESGGSICLG
jgi:hypothetical protein